MKRNNVNKVQRVEEYLDGKKIETSIYDPNGNRVETLYPNGYKSSFEYSRGGRLVREYRPQGDVICYNYNTRGKVNYIRTFKDDEDLNPKNAIREKHFRYNKNGDLTSEVDTISGKELKYTYNSINKISKMEVFDNGELVYSYRYYYKNSNLVSIMNQKGEETFYTYNKNGDIILKEEISTTNPTDLISYTYTYEDKSKHAKMLSKEDSKGRREDYKYDELGNMISKHIMKPIENGYDMSMETKLFRWEYVY